MLFSGPSVNKAKLAQQQQARLMFKDDDEEDLIIDNEQQPIHDPYQPAVYEDIPAPITSR